MWTSGAKWVLCFARRSCGLSLLMGGASVASLATSGRLCYSGTKPELLECEEQLQPDDVYREIKEELCRSRSPGGRREALLNQNANRQLSMCFAKCGIYRVFS